jgi:hypothetical protein
MKIIHVKIWRGTAKDAEAIGDLMKQFFDAKPELKKDYGYLVTNENIDINIVDIYSIIRHLLSLTGLSTANIDKVLGYYWKLKSKEMTLQDEENLEPEKGAIKHT